MNVFSPFDEEVVIRISQKWKFSTEFLGAKSFPIAYFENSYDKVASPKWFKLEADGSRSAETVLGEINLVFEYASLENKPTISGPTGSYHLFLSTVSLF